MKKNANLNKLVKSIRFRLNDFNPSKMEKDKEGNEVKVKCQVFSNVQILNAIEFALQNVNDKMPYTKFMLENFSSILNPILEHGAVSKLLYSQALLESGRSQVCMAYINVETMLLNQAREERDMFFQKLQQLNKEELCKYLEV